MQADKMPLDKSLKEMTSHGTTEFPIQFYIDELYKCHNKQIPLHWHSELEFYVVHGGPVLVRIGNHEIQVEAGDGIFLNSNTLHMFTQLQEFDKCECPNIVFSEEIISPFNSIINKKYINPIIMNQNLPYFVLHSGIEWHNDILKLLQYVFELLHRYGNEGAYGPLPEIKPWYNKEDVTCFELEVQRSLNQIWQLIYIHQSQLPQTIQNKSDLHSQIRLQQMVSYIHKHYSENITLTDIINAANISRSEAFRCFNSYMATSPINYLLQYRIQRAEYYLSTTSLSINEICFNCGFQSSSYFSKVFRAKTALTPSEFRSIKRI